MTPTKIKEAIERGHQITLEVEKLSAEAKALKKLLVTEALSRPQEHEQIPDSDGTAWNFRAESATVAVIFPTDSLKESISVDSKVFEQIEVLISKPHDIPTFFDRVDAFKPCHEFRKVLTEALGPKVAERILKLCTTASSPKVVFKAA